MTINPDKVQPDIRAPTAVIAEYMRGSISLSYLLNQAWTGRFFIVATTIAGLFYGIYSVYDNGPHFTATIKISPAEAENGIGDIGSGAGGLLAGLTGSTSTVALPKFTQFLIARGSVAVAQDLDKKYDMLCRIYSSQCDLATHTWKERTGLRESFSALLARLAGLPSPNGPRKIEDLAAYIASSVIAEDNKNNSLVAVHYTNSKPDFAVKFLMAVLKSTDDYLRAQNHDIQKRYVEYLSASAAKTVNVEQRIAIDTLLLQEERQLMMTEVDVPYAAKMLDAPVVTPVTDALKIIVISTFVGLLLGAAMASARDLVPLRWRVW